MSNRTTDYETTVLDDAEIESKVPAETLEWLAGKDDRTVRIQINAREPQHPYPKLEDRSYQYHTAAAQNAAVTTS